MFFRILNPNPLKRLIIIKGSKSLINTKTDCSTNDNKNEALISPKFESKESKKLVENNDQNIKLNNDLSFWLKCVTEENQTIHQLLNNKEFVHLCENISNSVSKIADKKLINLLNTFLIMGLDPNTRVIRYLENEILWRSKSFSLKLMLKCLSYHIRYESTQQQKQVVNELILRIPSKLDEAEDDEDVLLMLRLSKCFNEECVQHMENTALKMIVSHENGFKTDSLCYLIVLLSQLKRRTKPLIMATINKFNDMNEDEIQCSANNLINMISALNSLNFPNYELLQKSCTLLCNMKFLDEISSSQMRNLLIAINQLNFFYPRLMYTLIEKMNDKPDFFSSQDLLTFVITSARLYVRSPLMQQILSSYIIPKVEQKDLDNKSWLLYVWSLTIMGSVPIEHINSVLNNKFCDELLKNSDIHESVINKLKLLNIKAFAEIEMKSVINYPKILNTDLQMPKRQKALETFQNVIIECLNSFIPKDEFLSTNIITPLGFKIDAEFIIDSDKTPISLSEYGLFGADLNNNTKPLPHGFKRIAVMVYGYNDTLLDNSQLIGVNEFTIRLLKELNYSVIVINENKIPFNSSTFEKIELLQQFINNNV